MDFDLMTPDPAGFGGLVKHSDANAVLTCGNAWEERKVRSYRSVWQASES